ncbi:MAG: polysaccharide deacetylase family protein [Deferrisomatales bacterium]
MRLQSSSFKLLASRFLLLLGALLAFGSPALPAEPPHARVLLYHRVGDPRYPSTNVSTEAFRAQLDWLAENGFTVVPTEAIEGFLLRGQGLPDRAVAIHFDDGFRSVYDNAFPLLRERGLPFTVLLPTEAVDGQYPDYVTWEMVREMAGAGASIGAHGHRHLALGTPEPGEEPPAYLQRIREELRKGARRLARQGFPAAWVAYPYGEYGAEVLREAREAGFTLGFSQDTGALGRSHDPLCLPRFAVVGTLAEMPVFIERMGYLPLALEAPEPAPGALGAADPPRFAAVVRDPGAYVPDSLSLFVSELGRWEAHFDPASGRVVGAGGEPLTLRRNRVLVSLRHAATGRFAVGSWLLLRPESL